MVEVVSRASDKILSPQVLKISEDDLDRCQKQLVKNTLTACSGYKIDPKRISFATEQNSVEGGHGLVKRGNLVDRDGMTTIPVAVKILHTGDNIPSLMLQRRLSREVHILSMIRHKNIIKFHGFSFVEESAAAWLVYPWMSLGNSREYVCKANPTIEKRVQLLTDAAEGLMHLHSRKPPIRHGDIKAANFLVNDGLAGELCDFGLASPLQDPDFELLAMKSQIPGTVRWSSPETLRGDMGIEGDVWAWGLLAWEILTGTVPYPTITGEIAVVIQILQVNSKPILEGGSNVPDQLRALLERCWERSQEHRVTISIVLQELYKIQLCADSDSVLKPATRVSTPLQANEETPFFSVSPAYSSVKQCSAGNNMKLCTLSSPGSSPPDQSFTRNIQSSLSTLWKSCCCCPVATRRVPRSVLTAPNDGDDPEAGGMLTAPATSSTEGQRKSIAADPNSSLLSVHLEPQSGNDSAFSPEHNEQPRHLWLDGERVVGKPLRVPWQGRVLDTGLLLPRDVDPKILLEEEVVKWKALVHPSIHRILGYAVIQGIPHVITKWNANGNARDYLRRELSLGTTVDDRVAKLGQIATGISYLHRQNPSVVHANLKMENILIDESGNPVITDVGIFDFFHKHQLSTYGNSDDIRRLAPELWNGGPFTPASDVYAFGCLALEFLTGKKPFWRLDVIAEIVPVIRQRESPSMADSPELTGEESLWKLIECLCRRDMGERLLINEAVQRIDVWRNLRAPPIAPISIAPASVSLHLHTDAAPQYYDFVKTLHNHTHRAARITSLCRDPAADAEALWVATVTYQAPGQTDLPTWSAVGPTKSIARNRACQLAYRALLPDKYLEEFPGADESWFAMDTLA